MAKYDVRGVSVSERIWRFLTLGLKASPTTLSVNVRLDDATKPKPKLKGRRRARGQRPMVEVELTLEFPHMRLLHELECLASAQEAAARADQAKSMRALQKTCRNCARRYMCALSPLTNAARFCSLDCQSSFRYVAALRAHIRRYVGLHASGNGTEMTEMTEPTSASTASLTMPEEDEEGESSDYELEYEYASDEEDEDEDGDGDSPIKF